MITTNTTPVYDPDKTREILYLIIEYITESTRVNHCVHDRSNKVLLGGVLFWYEFTILPDKTKINPVIHFSKLPAFWDFGKIKSDLLLATHNIHLISKKVSSYF